MDLTVSVVPEKALFTMEIGQASYIPDPAHQYYLRYRPHPSYTDDVKVETNTQGLLTSIRSTTKDETPTILVNIARTIAAFETTEAPAAEPILKLVLDPLDPDEISQARRAIDHVISKYIDKAVEGCRYFSLDPGSPAATSASVLTTKKTMAQQTLSNTSKNLAIVENQLKAALKKAEDETMAPPGCDNVPDQYPHTKRACNLLAEKKELEGEKEGPTKVVSEADAALKSIGEAQAAQKVACGHFQALRKKKPRAKIEIESMRDSQPAGEWEVTVHPSFGGVPSADCSIGACYRPKEPYRITYSIGGGDETTIVELPNASPIVAIDIKRAFFIQKVQNMTFQDGFLLTLHIHKESELLAISRLPLDVLSAIGDGIQARVTITTEEKNLASKQAALLQERAKLNDARRMYESGRSGGLETSTSVVRRTTGGATSPPIVP